MSDEKRPKTPEEEPLDAYWDDIRMIRARPRLTTTTPDGEKWGLEKGDFAIGSSKERILVVIKPDGRLEYGPEYRPDEAAMIFWEAMGQRRLMMEERLLVIQHMEAVLVRLGRVDMEHERLRRQAAEEQNPDRKRELEQYAELMGNRLNMVAHQAIELGRGLVRRPEIPVPAMPEQVPRSLRDNDQTEYQGRDGLPEEDR